MRGRRPRPTRSPGRLRLLAPPAPPAAPRGPLPVGSPSRASSHQAQSQGTLRLRRPPAQPDLRGPQGPGLAGSRRQGPGGREAVVSAPPELNVPTFPRGADPAAGAPRQCPEAAGARPGLGGLWLTSCLWGSPLGAAGSKARGASTLGSPSSRPPTSPRLLLRSGPRGRPAARTAAHRGPSRRARTLTWDICGRKLTSLRSMEPGQRLCSSWHNRTPSRSAWARSKTTAEGQTTRWWGGRTLQSMSQRPHCRHCSMAPAPAGPASSGPRSGQSAAAAGHPARPRGARRPGRGFARAAPGAPAAPPRVPSSSASSAPRPRAVAGRAPGSRPGPPFTHASPSRPRAGLRAAHRRSAPRSAPPGASFCARGAPRPPQLLPRPRQRPGGSLAPRVRGLGRPRRRRFVRPAFEFSARCPATRLCSSAAPGCRGGGGAARGGVGAAPGAPAPPPRPPLPAPRPRSEVAQGGGSGAAAAPSPRTLSKRQQDFGEPLRPRARDLACGVTAGRGLCAPPAFQEELGRWPLSRWGPLRGPSGRTDPGGGTG